MTKTLVLVSFFVITAFAQSPFITTPWIDGTPLMFSKDEMQAYVDSLKISDSAAFQQFMSLSKISSVEADIGDERTFSVQNIDKSKYEQKTFVLKKIGTQIDIWVQKTELDNGHVTDNIVNEIYSDLENTTPSASINPAKGIFEIDVDVFGSPPDVDSNNKVYFLLTDIQDGWDPEKGGGFVGGFFDPNDQVTNNRADILYVDTYPGISSKDNLNSVLGTVAHELQHLIEYKNDADEEDWVNEGLSELASYLCGYGLRSPGYYLKNTNLQLNSWDNGDNIVLAEYSKVALLTYYAYEHYGLSFITGLEKDPGNGINGYNSTLKNYGDTFNSFIKSFFTILCSDNPNLTPQTTFDMAALQYLNPLPTSRIIEFPYSSTPNIKPYSLNIYEITNGNSLYVTLSGISASNILVTEKGYDTEKYLQSYSLLNYPDDDFGRTYHTQTVNILNTTSAQITASLQIDAQRKYDLISMEYGGNEPTYLITSTGNVNAIRFIASRDSAFIKSIEFYRSTDVSDLRFHIFTSSLSSVINPSSNSFLIKNFVFPEWVRQDVEDLKFLRNNGGSFDVGLEYITEGAMGYENVSNSASAGKSYLKLQGDTQYYQLNRFKVNDQVLNGIWMIRIEAAAPATPGWSSNSNGNISNLKVYPNPCLTKDSQLYIEYSYSGDPLVELKIYNTLGQLVFKSGYFKGNGLISWNGNKIAAGAYFVSLGTKNKKILKKVIFLH